jgi:hypothetical protein
VSAPDLSALREAVALVAERCDCGSSGCPFRTSGGMRPNDSCRMTHVRTRGHVVAALGGLFHAARAAIGKEDSAPPTDAKVWRAEAERLRRLLQEMVIEAEQRPEPLPKGHREWVQLMAREMERTP